MKQLVGLLESGKYNKLRPAEKVQYRSVLLDCFDAFLVEVDHVYRCNERAKDCFAIAANLVAGNRRDFAEKLFQEDIRRERISSKGRLGYALYLSGIGSFDEALRQVPIIYEGSESLTDVYTRVADSYYSLTRDYSKVNEYVGMDREWGRSGAWEGYYEARDWALNGQISEAVKRVVVNYERYPQARGLLTKLGEFLMNLWLYPQAKDVLLAEVRPTEKTSLALAHVDWMLEKIKSSIELYPKEIASLLESQWKRLVYDRVTSNEGAYDVLDSKLFASSYFDCLHLFHEVIIFQPYRFLSNSTSPVIVDGGSNCGFSLAYFKSIYPDSKIIAVEPERSNNALLSRNLRENGWENVSLQYAAISESESGIVDIRSQHGHSMNSSVLEGFVTGTRAKDMNSVKAISAADLIDTKIDYLKLDIEGAEAEALKAIGEKIKWVKAGFIEYHYRQGALGERNRLEDVLSVLVENGMRYYIEQPMSRVPKVGESELMLEFGRRWSLNIHFRNSNMS